MAQQRAPGRGRQVQVHVVTQQTPKMCHRHLGHALGRQTDARSWSLPEPSPSNELCGSPRWERGDAPRALSLLPAPSQPQER